MTQAFTGLRVIDTTHVLAGPFASYQMAVLGAEVIKVEHPRDPDQARAQGSDRSLNDRGMGTAFMSQAANKQALALDLKTPEGVEALRRLAATADVFVENYRPGAFEALGLGYKDLAAINPKLVYCSISAFGANGPKREATGYDNILQAYSGMMAMTGFGDGKPLKSGAPVVDYATGTTAAFAITAALFQRQQNDGRGQFIDVSMLDVALVLASSHVTAFTWNGSHPKQKANTFPFATIGLYQAQDAEIMIAASNLRQQRRLWAALGREDLIKSDNNQRLDGHAAESAALAEIIATMPALYWEEFFAKRRIPAARIRRMEEALADPQMASRPVVQAIHAPGDPLDGLRVPVAGFDMSDSSPSVSRLPQSVGAQSHGILRELGYDEDDITRMQAAGVVN